VTAVDLRGRIRPDRPLLVTATEEEAQFLTDGLPVLVTGVGKVNAAVSLAAAGAEAVRTWQLTVTDCARLLADWVAAEF
jgi:adenosylhomocysteine nucleosidase